MARASAPAADSHRSPRWPWAGSSRSPRQRRLTHRRARRRAHRHRLSGAASVSDSPAAASRSPRQPADRCDPISTPPRVVGADRTPIRLNEVLAQQCCLAPMQQPQRSAWGSEDSPLPSPWLRNPRIVQTRRCKRRCGPLGSGRLDRCDQTNPTLPPNELRPNESNAATRRTRPCNQTNPTLRQTNPTLRQTNPTLRPNQPDAVTERTQEVWRFQ